MLVFKMSSNINNSESKRFPQGEIDRRGHLVILSFHLHPADIIIDLSEDLQDVKAPKHAERNFEIVDRKT